MCQRTRYERVFRRCSAFLTCLVPSGFFSLRIAHNEAKSRSEGIRPRHYEPEGLAAEDGIQESRRVLYDHRTGLLLICGRDRAPRHRVVKVMPMHDPHTSDTRSEQGLPTPRCLCEGGNDNDDLPFSTLQPCKPRHQHDPPCLSFFVSARTSRRCMLSAVLALPTARSLFQL